MRKTCRNCKHSNYTPENFSEVTKACGFCGIYLANWEPKEDVPNINDGKIDELIRKQDAIDKIDERQRKLIYCFGFENDMVKIMDIAKSIITAIPPVQPEIPNNQTHLCAGCNYVYPECPASEADVVFGNGEGGDNICMCACFKPKEPKRGKWHIENNSCVVLDVCDQCMRSVRHVAPFYDFCPHCGAKMER